MTLTELTISTKTNNNRSHQHQNKHQPGQEPLFFTEQVFSIPYKRLCPNHKENKEKPMHHNVPHLYMLYLQALSCRHLTSHHTSFPNQT
ncbi:hypothetical protein UXP81_23020, partial [Enterobacter hormaechei]